MWSGIGHGGNQVEHVDKAESSRQVRDTLPAHDFSHPRHLQRPDHAAEVVVVRLNDIQTAIGQQPAKGVDAVLLFTPRDRNRKRIGDPLGPFEPIEEYRFFEVTVIVLFEQLTHPNRFVHVLIIPVGVGVKGHVVAEGLPNQRNDCLGPAGRTSRIQVLGHEHERTDLDLDGLGLALSHRRLDECHRFLDRLFPPFRRLVNRDMRVMNLPDQLSHGLSRYASHHVQDGELDGRQGDANSQAAEPEVEVELQRLFQQLIQPPCILVNEERLEPSDEDRVEKAHRIVGNRNPFRAILGSHPAEIRRSVLQ